jgi:glycosyltransferase involved in cell wall biosynthesis
MRIVCVHQGYELYGSDRCFAECVVALRNAYPKADIEVVLPRRGPILELLEGVATTIAIEPIWVLRRRNLMRLATVGLLQLPTAVLRAARRFRRADLVYINTSVIADYTIAARFFCGRALLHIHEIPEGLTLTILRRLARFSRAEIIFNSRATSAAFALPRNWPSQVIYNGVRGPAAPEPVTFDGGRPLNLLMLGRVNRIKGQETLLAALNLLSDDLRARVKLRIVGGAFEDKSQEEALAALVRESGLGARVSLEPFSNDSSALYRWADIVVVPSRRPESLGRVAIEAMAFGRPVIASRIGGLAEVVDDAKTGWLTPPGDTEALAQVIASIIENPPAWRGFAAAARQRYEALFREEDAAKAIAAVAAAKLRGRAGGGPSSEPASAMGGLIR